MCSSSRLRSVHAVDTINLEVMMNAGSDSSEKCLGNFLVEIHLVVAVQPPKQQPSGARFADMLDGLPPDSHDAASTIWWPSSNALSAYSPFLSLPLFNLTDTYHQAAGPPALSRQHARAHGHQLLDDPGHHHHRSIALDLR